LAPALAAVRQVDPNRRIYLAMPPGNTGVSRHLTSIGNLGYFFINEAALRSSQLPTLVADQLTGRSYSRPPKWG